MVDTTRVPAIRCSTAQLMRAILRALQLLAAGMTCRQLLVIKHCMCRQSNPGTFPTWPA
jgi:hypothetical protein